MLNTRVKEFLEEKGFGDRLTEHAETIDTAKWLLRIKSLELIYKDGGVR